MADTSCADIETLLEEARRGEAAARERLWSLVYDELRRLAHRKLRRPAGGASERARPLQTTALVHEAYLRLVGDADLGFETAGAFWAAAGNAMRNVLVDEARRRGRLKRQPNGARLGLGDPALAAASPDVDHLALDEALTRLDARDPDLCQLVTLRFYAGLSIAETASVLGVSTATVERHWNYARALLLRELLE